MVLIKKYAFIFVFLSLFLHSVSLFGMRRKGALTVPSQDPSDSWSVPTDTEPVVELGVPEDSPFTVLHVRKRKKSFVERIGDAIDEHEENGGFELMKPVAELFEGLLAFFTKGCRIPESTE